MNYKLEKFWNCILGSIESPSIKWTINLKSFEIPWTAKASKLKLAWTINLKSFEINASTEQELKDKLWTINLKSFEILI